MPQFLSQYGFQIVGALVGFAGTASMVYGRRQNAKTDLDTKKENAVLDAQAVPLKLLQDELRKREQELSELRAQDKMEREEYLKTLSGIQATMEKMAASLDRQEQRQDQHAQRVESRLDDVDNRLLVIETRQQAAT